MMSIKKLENKINNSGMEGEALESALSKLEKTMKGLSRRADEAGESFSFKST